MCIQAVVTDASQYWGPRAKGKQTPALVFLGRSTPPSSAQRHSLPPSGSCSGGGTEFSGGPWRLQALGGWEGSEGRGADWAVQKRRGPLIGSPSAWFAAPRVAAVSEAARYLAPLLHDKFSPVHLTAIVLRAPRARFA